VRAAILAVAFPALLTAPTAILLPTETNASHPDGEVLLEEHGVTVRVRRVDGYPMGELTAIGEFDASPEEVFEVIWDVPSRDDMIPSIKSVQTISVGSTRRVDYMVIDTGVPMVKERDVVSEATVRKRTSSEIIIDFRARDGVGPEPVRNRVRIPVQEGRWELVALDGDRTQVTYTIKTDPGGDIPKKAVRSFAAKSIPQLFDSIRDRIK
jgi:carbon monoxide dehydrogenase subunit G